MRIKPQGQTDAEIVDSSIAHPEEFASLFDRHAEVIHRYLVFRAGHPAADDLLSDTFLAAFRARSSYDQTQRDARPWLYGIAAGALANHRRSEVRRRDLAMRLANEPGPRTTPSAEEAVTAHMTGSEAVLRALTDMDADYRDVVLVVVATGMTYEEAARALAVPVGTIRSRLFRGRRQIRDALVVAGMVVGMSPPDTTPTTPPHTAPKTGDLHA